MTLLNKLLSILISHLGKDLIYEGIETLPIFSWPFSSRTGLGKDLIYEGIETREDIQTKIDPRFLGKDLIYEGIETAIQAVIAASFAARLEKT